MNQPPLTYLLLLKLRHLCAALLGMCLTSCLLPPAACAEAPYPLEAKTAVRSVLRSSPGTNSEKLQVFDMGSMVTILGKSGNWYQVEFGEWHGYMRDDLLFVTGAAKPLSPAPTRPSGPVVSLSSENALGMRVLYEGCVGSDVRQLQQLLLSLGINPQGVDGVFGAGTHQAVIYFQGLLGLSADGIVGPGTIASLMHSLNSSSLQTPGPSKPPPVSPMPLQSGAKGERVRKLQERLYDLGYLAAQPTGNYLSLTTAAVYAFQEACGLVPDGIASTQTQRLLFAEDAPFAFQASPSPTPGSSFRLLQKGSSGEAVRQLQQALANLGYYNGTLDGHFEKGTLKAVKWFQQNNGIGADGIAGTATQAVLYGASPRPAWEAAATASPSTQPSSIGVMTAPPANRIELAHWFSDIQRNYLPEQNFLAYDPASGLGWTMRFRAMGNHADSDPLTRQDTDIMRRAFGSLTTWSPKPIYARMPDGRWVLATLQNAPHLSGSLRDNGFDGHLCVYFYRDMDEVTENDPGYGVQNQRVLLAAWERVQ